MPEVRTHRFAELSSGDLACWDAWQRANADLESPCFRPEFFAVANEIVPVEVAVLREGDSPLAFFPFERSRLGIALPVTGGMNDFHGLVSPAGAKLDMRQFLRDSGIVAAEMHCVPEEQTELVQPLWVKHASYYLDLSQGFEAYCLARKRAGSETVEKTLRKARRLAREGRGRFELRAPAELPLKLLLQWKNEQHAGLGVLTPLQSPTTQQLLKQFLQVRSERFEAFVSVLWIDDLPAAIGYSLKSGPVAHLWFIGYDEKYSRSSPGVVLILKMAEALAAEGATRLHLGKGDERFKTSLASDRVLVAEGMAGERSVALSCLAAWRRTKHWMKRSPFGFGVRFMRPLRRWWTYGQAHGQLVADAIE
jgi:CelD/BcsL family acetyltransferase involved in cellulose biosynthesis